MMIRHPRLLLARCILVAILVSIVAVPFLATGNAAASPAQAGVVQSRADSATGHATIIVLDMSGSMSAHDPNGLRCSAAKAYIDLSGVNDYIGLVGLDNNSGQTTGNHNFQAAQSWTNPLSTATRQDKTNLKNILDSSSNSCRPDANTPTYDSLSKAYDMLSQVTAQHNVSGSVILLTDGVPCPGVDAQINAIRSDLLPKFQERGWPIDTIGLGEDAPIASTSGCTVAGTLPGTFHDFLKGISNATSGTFYDDSHGPVSGVSPLNIGPFFAEIFAKYSGKQVHKDIPPTQLGGGTQQQNFNVVDGTTDLDVIVVRDNPNLNVTLLNPQGQVISANNAGVLYSGYTYNLIYQITGPQSGPWILSVSGSGQYLMYDLQQTDIGLSVNSVKFNQPSTQFVAPKPLPLAQPIQVQAQVTSSGQLLSDSTYTVTGYVSYNSTVDDCTRTQSAISFTMSNNAGTYTGNFTINSGQAGTYGILLCATFGTSQNVIANELVPVRLEIFPDPRFISQQTSQPTDAAVVTTVIAWPGIIQWLYSLPILNHLSGWPLGGLPAKPVTNLPAIVQWQGNPYPGATVTATASSDQASNVPVTIVPESQGRFAVQFIPPGSGQYTINFDTSGSYNDSYGDFGQTPRIVNVTVEPETLGQLGFALLITIVYFIIFLFLILLVRFWLTPSPFGSWAYNAGGSSAPTGRQFGRARRGLYQWFVHRNVLTSRQAGMPSGLQLRFRWGHRIEARSDGSPRSREWQSVSQRYTRVQSLTCISGSSGMNGGEESRVRYVINDGSRPSRSSRQRSTPSRKSAAPSRRPVQAPRQSAYQRSQGRNRRRR
jgi:hypothetical protein